MNSAVLRLAIEGHLGNQHSTLYGQAYDLSDEGRRAMCVEFLANAIQGVDAELKKIPETAWTRVDL